MSHVPVTPRGQCRGQCVKPPQGSVFASQHITDKTAVAADLVGVSLCWTDSKYLSAIVGINIFNKLDSIMFDLSV